MPDPSLPGIGHNNGPTMDEGHRWRTHAWARAKAQAAPRLPVEMVRLRMRRADELGMSYRRYASLRASAGRDVAVMVFTSSALGLYPGQSLGEPVRERLLAIRYCKRVALLSAPLDPVALAPDLPFDRIYRAPAAYSRWPALRAALGRIEDGPAAGTLLIGAAPGEAEWVAAGRLGAYLPAHQYFEPLV